MRPCNPHVSVLMVSLALGTCQVGRRMKMSVVSQLELDE